ncbi:hypothetical protein J7M22_12580 [Candidatus Poribacteria bacterium]|nr:hypothetical protein [Candidatus Poribacteria bacterium]
MRCRSKYIIWVVTISWHNTIPRGKHIINEGDELFLISTAEDIKKWWIF